jgi:hypothetical protein
MFKPKPHKGFRFRNIHKDHNETTTTKEDVMSKNHQNQNRSKSQSPFGTFLECVGVAVVTVASVPGMIVNAVIASVSS